MLRGRKSPALAEERYGVKYHNLSARRVRIYPEFPQQHLFQLRGYTVSKFYSGILFWEKKGITQKFRLRKTEKIIINMS